MKRPQLIFTNGFSLTALEARYTRMGVSLFSFMDPGCCIDSTPPIPFTAL